MIKCVRCGEMVDESTRTTCPQCLTPLASTDGAQPPHVEQSAPAPEPMMLVPGTVIGNMRVSLTGELIEINPSSQSPAYAGGSVAPPPQPAPKANNSAGTAGLGVRKAPSVKGNASAQPLSTSAAVPPPYNAPPASTAPRPTPRPTAAPMRPMETAQPKRGSNVGVIVVVLLLIVGGAGAYMFMQNRSNPKENAEKWMRAMIKHDYTTMYELSAWKGNDIPKSAADLKTKMQTELDVPGLGKTTPEKALDLINLTLVSVGEPKTAEGKTTVPMKLKISILGQEQSQDMDLPLKMDSGKWKVESTANGIGDTMQKSLGGGQ